MNENDEIIADSEGEDDALLIPNKPAGAGVKSAVSANVSIISEFSTHKPTASGDSISDFSSVAPAKPRPKPRPLPKSTSNNSSSANFHTFDMVLSIADRAKMRQRGNNSSSYPATPEIIELSDDDDELALRPTRKPRAKAKSKPAQTEPESSLPVATSPISIHHPVLPPSDPPQSTPDEFGLPPIAILPNPASSITSLPRTDDLDLDEEMPPAFFAPDTSPPNTHVPTTTGALHMDSVLMPPPVAPDVPKTAKKTHSRKKNNDDEGDEDEFVPGREGKQKTKKTRGKGKDKAQNKEKTVKTKSKAKGKEKAGNRQPIIDDVFGDIGDELDYSTSAALALPRPPSTPNNVHHAEAYQGSPGTKRVRSSGNEEEPEPEPAPRKKMRLSDVEIDGNGDLGAQADADMDANPDLFIITKSVSKSRSKAKKNLNVVVSDNEDEDENDGERADVNTSMGPSTSAKSSSSLSPSKSPSRLRSKSTKSKVKSDVAPSKSKPKAKGNKKDVDLANADMEVELDDKGETDSSVKENVPAPPTTASASPAPVPATPAPVLKFPTLASRYTIAPKTARRSTPMSELIRRVNSMPNSQFNSPMPAKKGKSAAGTGNTGESSEEVQDSGSGLTAYSPYLKSSRAFLSRIAPLHPNRRDPPPLPPPPPPRRKSRKELEWEKKTVEEKEELEEKWEEELVEWVGGRGEWTSMGEEARKTMLRGKKERELGLGGWED